VKGSIVLRIPVLAAALIGTAGVGTGQFNPTSVTWRVRATRHFDIYYAQSRDLDAVAREAERAYARVSRDVRKELSASVPLILLPTSRELPHNEQEAAVIVRATGAPPRDHLLLSVEPSQDREQRLAHELTHIFEFERRRDRTRKP
jgi:hypothetical protein